MEPQFHPVDETYLDVLIGFIQAFYALDNYPFDEQLIRSVVQKLIGDSSLGRVWLITLAEQAVGYVVLTFGYSLEFHGRDAFVDELFIAEDYRHQGLGTKTIQFVTDSCRHLGVQALHLEVERTNLPAQQLYRQMGFRDHDRYLLTKWTAEGDDV